MLHGYSSTTRTDILMGAGVLMVGATIVGVSKGSFTFDPGKTFRNPDFDGKSSPIHGLDRIISYNSKLSGVLMEWNERILEYLEHGQALGTAVSGVQTQTPKEANTLFPADNINYVQDLRFLMDLGGGELASILFPRALVESYSVKGTPEGEGEISVTFAARLAGTDPDPCPYTIERRTAVPAA